MIFINHPFKKAISKLSIVMNCVYSIIPRYQSEENEKQTYVHLPIRSSLELKIPLFHFLNDLALEILTD